jgi:hypothetical protein
MKYLIFIIAFFCINSMAFSQDSITIKTELDTFTKANYEGQFDYVFARKEARKQLFKMGGMINKNSSYIEFAYERKLTTNFSINASLINTIEGDLIDNIASKVKLNTEFNPTLTSIVKVGIEPRWYYTMKKDIKNGLISDNLNGNYVGIRTYIDYDKHFGIPELNSYNLSHELTWGMQRRILHNQYFDFNIGAGYYYRSNNLTGNSTTIGTTTINTRDPDKWILNYRFTYGFILDKNLLKKNKEVNCDALRCFEEEKSLWKIGMSNAIAATEQGATTELSISNETKINNSQWSIETKLGILGDFYNSQKYEFKSEYYRIGLQITPRFYWDLNKRIAQGKSGNNLSGKYFGLSINNELVKYRYTYSNPSSTPNSSGNLQIKSFSIAPNIGYQKRLLNHLYMDANIGYKATSFYNEDQKLGSFWRNGLSANFTFGLSF